MYLGPSKQQLDNLMEYFKNGKIEDAKKIALYITNKFPKYQFGWKALGTILINSGKSSEALNALQTAVELSPKDAEAHNNLGFTYENLGEFDKALNSYIQALKLNPNYVSAYENLSSVFKKNSFDKMDRDLYPFLENLLMNKNFVRPSDVSKGIINLLKHDSLLSELLTKLDSLNNLSKTITAIQTLKQLPLLLCLMRISPIQDLQLEKLFKTIRKILLNNINHIEETQELISFLSTLSLHCFTNEYIYFEGDEEVQQVEYLENKISQTVTQIKQVRLIDVLCLATYRPLISYAWCNKLQLFNQIPEIKLRLIEQPLIEKTMAKSMPILRNISDDTSIKVMEQYKENPYPRWEKIKILDKKMTITKFCDQYKLRLYNENIKNIHAPEILIAGCGTGQNSIEFATSFLNSQVTAIDLSAPSLAYAQRKTKELGIKNLEYLRGDILDLRYLDRKFDIIDCSGVLHHMKNPMKGWKTLVDLLKSSGFMRIGLYSKLARVQINKIRNDIMSLGINSSKHEIKKFRQSLIDAQNEDLQELITFRDFYSLSELTDLLFHVEESHFTIPQIQTCLTELGLKFCGLHSKDIIFQFKNFFGNNSDIYNLTEWNQFEEKKPNTFTSMYQLWCQKP